MLPLKISGKNTRKAPEILGPSKGIEKESGLQHSGGGGPNSFVAVRQARIGSHMLCETQRASSLTAVLSTD